MTRTHDETKKGLECCGKGLTWDETCGTGCPYEGMGYGECSTALSTDALALIQHKEQENAQQAETIERLNDGCHKLLVKIQQLEAERDAAVEALKDFGGCMACKSANVLKRDSPCKECILDGQVTRDYWIWRGVQKD